jgi:hypothetical protein
MSLTIVLFLHSSKIVLVAVQDDAQRMMTSYGYRILRKLQARGSLRIDYRGTFTLIGYTGRRRPRFVKQVCMSSMLWALVGIVYCCFYWLPHSLSHESWNMLLQQTTTQPK